MKDHGRSHWNRWWMLLLVLVGGAAFGWSQFSGNDGGPEYQTVGVRRGDLIQTVTATGQLTAVVNVQVGSQISGNIQKLFADYNSPVKAGDVVAQIDDSTYRAIAGGMEGELESARAKAEMARLTEERKRGLVEGKGVSQTDYDQALADLHQAGAEVKIRQAALEKARIDLERCSITAPIDGIVVSRNVDVGQTVAASLQAPVLFTIAKDLTKMNIEANVSEADIGGVRDGQVVTFTVDAFPERTFQGKVVQVRYAPVIVENVVSYVTVIGVENPTLELRPGMTANVAIETDRRVGAIAVSNAALRFRPPAPESRPTDEEKPPAKKREAKPKAGGTPRRIYCLRNGIMEPVEVVTGLSTPVETEIVSGLNDDDLVVTGVLSAKPTGSGAAANPFGGNSTRDLVPQGGGGGR